MQIQKIEIKAALNKAYLKEKVNRADIDLFKKHLADFFEKINEQADEAHLKSLTQDLLNDSFYKGKFQINPIGRNDLVIHTGKLPSDPIGVILEVKSIANKAEMISGSKPNAKAIHELILYYLTERITHNKHEIKQLIVTNIYEWFVFDANEFDKKIYRNTKIKKLYEQKVTDSKDNIWFYEEIRKLLGNEDLSLDATYFDIRDFKQPALDSNNANDVKLIALYKILSPVHLLKLSFANDSNSLQPKFYSELLHLIGLYEYKDGSKKLISRKKEGERNVGSLIENAILNLERHDKIASFELLSRYGEKYQEQIYNIALELVITWINRILFLKLLEAQLSNYHKGDESYRFLNKDKIRDFKDLDNLFFGVLAIQLNERKPDVVKEFKNVPYLNSSLFEATELEKQTIAIDSLNYRLELPILTSSILRSTKNKTQSDALPTLDYLFEFLKAYDFSSESAEEIQEDNKPLINASVLGLIFEKINGYKDGSFFTPGFITMYMCRETIRRAVVQKFNDTKGWELKDYSELYNKIRDDSNRKAANTVINSLKICDPAVGSGHFLVSALNELIAIKSDLNVLISSDGRTLNDYHIEVVNDELIVTDENNDPFKYNFHDARSQTVQQTLFHEKQTIIENCLFGVDINPNSVKICRLRLWIELLKNAYYKPTTNGQLELETLPNIDINIKTGNSLISRFALDADLKQALKKNSITIDAYRKAVDTYRNARDKKQKREMENIINTIKSNFRTEISRNAKEYAELSKLRGQLQVLISTNQDLFGVKRSQKDLELEQRRLELSIEKQEETIEEIKNNKIYENAFEWRFEFPEVLNNEGGFVGFDVVIGNPPYINALELKKILSVAENKFYKSYYKTAKGTVDIYVYFFELAVKIASKDQYITYITPNRYLSASYGYGLREFLLNETTYLTIGDYSNVAVFKEASTYPILTFLRKNSTKNYIFNSFTYINETENFVWRIFNSSTLRNLNELIIGYVLNDKFDITKKIIDQSVTLTNAGKINATSTAGEAEDYHDYINEVSGLKLINTGTIDRYETTWGKIALTDKKQKYLMPYLPQDNSILSNNRISLYSNPKIVIAKIAIRTEAFFDQMGEYASINTNCIHSFSKDFNPYYILGWLNSKLFQYTFKCFFEGLKMAGGYMQYSSPNLSNMYIKKVESSSQNSIAEVVKRVIDARSLGTTSNYLESQIDQLVYQLYNLTPEEIKIVEGEV